MRVLIASVLCSTALFLALVGFGAIDTRVLTSGGADIDLITGGEALAFPRVTQNESAVWGHGNSVVVAYIDSSGGALSPASYCGVSTSTDGGVTFTRLPYKFNTGGACYGYPSVVYSAHAAKWFASFLATRCGGQGVGQWTSPDGINWSNGSCVFSGTQADLLSIWVDNNPASPFYGRQYALYNDFSIGSGAVQAVRSVDDGVTWSAPVTVYASFRRAWKVTGSLGTDGTVFAQTVDEGGGGLENRRQNFIHRSTNGGVTWSAPITQGPTFLGPGRSVDASSPYFVGMYSTPVAGYWREMGWGEPAVGPNGVVHYAYSAHGPGSDPGDIFYVRSTDNGMTWSVPLKLNTDVTTRAQWSPSVSVNTQGKVFVSWYDERNTTTDALERVGRASLDNGATWGAEMALSDVIFPKPLQPDPNVNPTYVGLFSRTAFSNDGNGNIAYQAWTDGRVTLNGSPQQDIFFDKISFAGCPSFFSENFDDVTAPALPGGWVAANPTGPAPLWVTSSTTSDTPPNVAFIDDAPVVSDKRLDTPGIVIPSAPVQVSFSNFYNLEGSAPNFYDGGVLEVSSPNINGGVFTDITDAAVGGSFVSGGYVGAISNCCGNPLAGRMAWSQNSGGYVTTVANLGPNVAGQTIKLRFRMGSDSSSSASGWQIDSLALTSLDCPAAVLSAVSRKIHGAAGPFDINLPLVPLGGAVGIEDRTGTVAGDHQMVVTFANSVTVGGVSVTAGTGSVSSFSVSGAVVTINLTGVANAQRLGVTLASVSDGTNLGSVMVPMGVLSGDTTGNGTVTASDVSQAKLQSGQPVSASNFRNDVIANGAINATDVANVKLSSGTALP